MADLGELIREWNSVVEKSKLLQLQSQPVSLGSSNGMREMPPGPESYKFPPKKTELSTFRLRALFSAYNSVIENTHLSSL